MVKTYGVLAGGQVTERYYVEVTYVSLSTDAVDLDAHGDAMMEALQAEPNLIDPDVGVNFDHNTVDVCAAVAAEDPPAALRLVLLAVRSALRHVGGATPGWDRAVKQAVSSIRPTQLIDS